MKVYQTNEIKNIALLGSYGSGKTTLVDCLLYTSNFAFPSGGRTEKTDSVFIFQHIVHVFVIAFY